MKRICVQGATRDHSPRRRRGACWVPGRARDDGGEGRAHESVLPGADEPVLARRHCYLFERRLFPRDSPNRHPGLDPGPSGRACAPGDGREVKQGKTRCIA